MTHKKALPAKFEDRLALGTRAGTFSLAARDPETGQLAVGGASHWFAYYRLVPFAEAGIGAVATQAETNVTYSAKIFKKLKTGQSVKEALDTTVSADKNNKYRQVIAIDAAGNTAGYTGEKCIDYNSHILEKDLAIAGNMLANDKVLSEIHKSYIKNVKLPFALRVIKALQAGDIAGGDFRGKRSAGLLVVDAKKEGTHMDYVVYDIRIDDHQEPLKEMERLYDVSNAYRFMEEGDKFAFEAHDTKKAFESYQKAFKLSPGNLEIKFWYAKLLHDLKKEDEANKVIAEVIEVNPKWKEFWERVSRKK